MIKISFLIPTTSKGKTWTHMEDTLLYKNTLSTFIPEKKNHLYSFYIGYDHDDYLFKNCQNQNILREKFPNFAFYFIEFPSTIFRGHLTQMWNILLENAISNGSDYFYQCGDDILFKTPGWVQQSIQTLLAHQDIGITGPSNDHPELLTQVFFSRKHHEIFGFLFPSYIFNWGCDDWINKVYMPNYIYPLVNFYAENAGGAPRYDTSKYDLKKLKQTAAKKADEERNKIARFLGKF